MVFSASPRTVMSSVMRWRSGVMGRLPLGLSGHENTPMLSLTGEAVDDHLSRREKRGSGLAPASRAARSASTCLVLGDHCEHPAGKTPRRGTRLSSTPKMLHATSLEPHAPGFYRLRGRPGGSDRLVPGIDRADRRDLSPKRGAAGALRPRAQAPDAGVRRGVDRRVDWTPISTLEHFRINPACNPSL